MIKLPDFKKSFDYENNFYLSCQPIRIVKLLVHYEIFKKVNSIPGAIVDCGVFKGSSLVRFAMLRDLFGNNFSKKIIGFDVFGKFPKSKYVDDKKDIRKFVKEAGNVSISKPQLLKILKNKGLETNVDLVKGDITKTVPKYLKKHPELRISLLNLDVDIYEPSVTILEYLYPRIVKGGILLLDDFGFFSGETQAIEEYFRKKKIKIKKHALSMTPAYVIKK